MAAGYQQTIVRISLLVALLCGGQSALAQGVNQIDLERPGDREFILDSAS